MAAIGIAAVVLLVIAGTFAVRGSGGGVSGDPRRSLIIFPFRNLTGDADRDWLEAGAANMLGLTLAHWEELTVYDDERTRSLLRQAEIDDPGALDVERARDLARKANVGTLVIGDIRRLQDSVVIEAKLHDVRTGRRVSTEVVRVGASDDPRAAFDTVAARILRVGRVPPGEHPGAVAQTTRSLDAYRLYLGGMNALQGFHIDSAQRLFERAIATDSTFALAYLRLTQTLGWRRPPPPPGPRLELARLAERHGTALPTRLRTLIQIELAQREREFPRARLLARSLIAQDSLDSEAWYQLGEAEFHHRVWMIPHADSLGNAVRALRAFEQALAIDSAYHIAYRHIVELLFACSDYPIMSCARDSAVYAPSLEELFVPARSDSMQALRQQYRQALGPTLRSWVAAEPTSREAHEVYLLWLIDVQRFAEAERQLDRFKALQPDSIAHAPYEAIVALGGQRYAEAGRAAASLLPIARDSARARRYLGPWGMDFRYGLMTWLSAAGRVREARDAAEILLPVLPSSGPTCLPLPDRRCVPITREMQKRGMAFGLRQTLPTSPAELRRALREAIAAGRRDSLAHLVFVSANASVLLNFRLTRDTSALAEWLRASRDTLYPFAHAALVLARGDSAGARRLVDRHASRDSDVPEYFDPWRENDLLSRYMWADILAGLGESRRALGIYERLDATWHEVRWPTPSHMIRVMSFAERALLHEQLGEREKAIELYEKFAEAWQDADSELQPMVRRARESAARLRGESGGRAPDS